MSNPPISKPSKLYTISPGSDNITQFVVVNDANNKKAWVPLLDCDCIKVRNGRTYKLEYVLKK